MPVHRGTCYRTHEPMQRVDAVSTDHHTTENPLNCAANALERARSPPTLGQRTLNHPRGGRAMGGVGPPQPRYGAPEGKSCRQHLFSRTIRNRQGRSRGSAVASGGFGRPARPWHRHPSEVVSVFRSSPKRLVPPRSVALSRWHLSMTHHHPLCAPRGALTESAECCCFICYSQVMLLP